jgi:hypothetical protein
MTVRRDLDGLRVQLPGDPAIYLMDRGQKRHIPDPTYNNLFRDWNGVVQDANLDEIDTGPPLTEGAFLVQAFGEAAIYVVDGAQKRRIASPGTMDRYYLAWDRVQHVTPSIIAAILTGPQIAWPE